MPKKVNNRSRSKNLENLNNMFTRGNTNLGTMLLPAIAKAPPAPRGRITVAQNVSGLAHLPPPSHLRMAHQNVSGLAALPDAPRGRITVAQSVNGLAALPAAPRGRIQISQNVSGLAALPAAPHKVPRKPSPRQLSPRQRATMANRMAMPAARRLSPTRKASPKHKSPKSPRK
jgi:hypothetical protein